MRFLSLTPEQDEALRKLELSPVVNAKVRLRASIIRLNGAGWGVPKLVTHFGRNPQSVHNDLDRFEQIGVEGLADGKAPGNKPSVTPEITAFLGRKLAEDRVWNSSLLSEAVAEQFGVSLGREVIRVTLLELGYSGKRARYAPGKAADPDVVIEHRASLETLSWIKRHLPGLSAISLKGSGARRASSCPDAVRTPLLNSTPPSSSGSKPSTLAMSKA